MVIIPKPKTIENALKLFPGVTANARYFSAAWQFRLECEQLFLFATTPRRRKWQTAFRDAWRVYRKVDISDWEVTQMRRKP
jgi:hypothetical protein